VLDPANYGSLTIDGPVSIEGHGWASIAPVSGGNAITITANTSDKINIIGVVLDGTALANTTGIAFYSGGTLTVRDSVIRNFAGGGVHGNGILVQPNGSTQIVISNTVVLDNDNAGIYLTPTGSGTLTASIDQVTADHNSYGIYIDSASTSGPLYFSITDSHADGNNPSGIVSNSSAGDGITSGVVKNTTVSGSVRTNGIVANGAHTSALLTHSVLNIDAGMGLNINGATVYSDGTNNRFGASVAGVQSFPPF
jgi:hypothetical protein